MSAHAKGFMQISCAGEWLNTGLAGEAEHRGALRETD